MSLDDTNEELKFFGSVTASISHEIKNIIAVINENAGLLEDMTLLSQKGIPLDYERLIRLSSELQKQVDRADTVVKRLNIFAHSVDEDVASIDLKELMEYFLKIFSRIAALKNVRCLAADIQSGLFINANRFLFLKNLWEIAFKTVSIFENKGELEFSTNMLGNDKYIIIKASESVFNKEDGITFDNIGNTTLNLDYEFQDNKLTIKILN